MSNHDLPLNSDPLDSLSKDLSDACFVLGFVSIAASIAVWAKAKHEDRGHGERFGIFVGLWAPTFFILSDRLSRRKA